MDEVFELLDKMGEHISEAHGRSALERARATRIGRRTDECYFAGQLDTLEMMARLLGTLRAFYRDKAEAVAKRNGW